MPSDTIFDKIIRKEIKADIVFENETVIAFRDINPAGPVHVLVVPKKKVSGFDSVTQLSPEEAGRYMIAIAKVAAKLDLAEGYRVVFNVGQNAQQSVDYIHAHIIGGRAMGWPPG